MKTRHNATLTIILAAGLALPLASCSKDADEVAASTDNGLLAYVPDDTPYLAGNLQTIPDDVIDATFRRLQPALDAAQSVLADSSISLSGSAARENPEVALVGAVLNELDGKLSRQGLESMGFTMEPYQVVYGLGVFPVFRISVGNAQALRDTLGRIESNSGMEFPELQHQGQAYWKIVPSSADTHGDTPVAFYLAIIEESSGPHLAVGVLPEAAEAELLPAFLGQARPQSSNAALRLAEVNQAYGYTAYGTGLLDFQRLFAQFTDSDSLMRRSFSGFGHELDEELSPACKAEIESLVARAPRMVVGTTELTPSVMAGQYRLEMADDLASDLAGLVSEVPAAPSQTDRLLEFAFGIRVGAARDFLIRKATEYSQKTYECEALQHLPEKASEALVKLNYPLPPLVNNFLGIRASLSGMPEDQSDLSQLEGMVALHVAQPEMFVGMAQMFLPQLAEFQLVKGEPPVRLPESLMPMPGVEAYAAMSDSALGIALGEGEQSRLTDYLGASSQGDGSFLSMNYDMAAYMDKMDQLSSHLGDSGLGGYTDESGEHGDNREEARKIAEAFETAFRNMAGRSHLSLRFDRHGFAVDSSMTFSD